MSSGWRWTQSFEYQPISRMNPSQTASSIWSWVQYGEITWTGQWRDSMLAGACSDPKKKSIAHSFIHRPSVTWNSFAVPTHEIHFILFHRRGHQMLLTLFYTLFLFYFQVFLFIRIINFYDYFCFLFFLDLIQNVLLNQFIWITHFYIWI